MFIPDFSALTKRLRASTMFSLLIKPKKGFLNLFGGYKDIVTVNELCEMLNIGKNTAYELLQSGAIKSIKIGKVYRIPKKYVIEYIENFQNRP